MSDDLEEVRLAFRVPDFVLGIDEPTWALKPSTAGAAYDLANTSHHHNIFVDDMVPRLRQLGGAARDRYQNDLIESFFAVQRSSQFVVDALFEINAVDVGYKRRPVRDDNE